MQIKDFIFRSTNLVTLTFFFLMFSSFKANPHPYYISVTEIRFNSEQKTISLSCKMFTDDLQDALHKLYKTRVNLMRKSQQADSLISKYVKARMEIVSGGRKADFHYLGYEIEEEATWCYFESKLISDEKHIRVKSSILYDFIESQTNFVHCYYNNERKSHKLDNPDQSAAFSF